MQILTQNYKYNPNAMVSSVWSGIAQGNRTVTTITKPSLNRNRMESTRIYGPGLPRGQGGHIGVLVLGGMVTTLAEVEDIVAARKAKKFVPKRGQSEIAEMCRFVADRRNEAIMEARKRQPAFARPKRTVRLHLPVGVKWVGTSVPGLKLAVRE